ncbi:RNA-directed DNA polymerase, eukaryota [Tanacetum coccineum]
MLLGFKKHKVGVVDDLWIEDIWEGKGYDFAQLPANGNSGGIILNGIRGFSHVKRRSEMTNLLQLRVRGKGAWCIFGDLNVVRSSDNRINSQVNVKETNELNDFITDMRLVEIQWVVVALDRKLSDHCLIVLKDVELDFGPKPFRVFNIWMEELDFIQVVEEAWKKDMRSFRPDCIFRDRLKNVKASVRVWSKERFGGHKERIETLKIEAMRWELEAEKRMLNDIER